MHPEAAAALDFIKPRIPVLPCTHDRTGAQIVFAGEARFGQVERRHKPERVCLNLKRRIARGVDRTKCKLFQADAGHGCTMPPHQDNPVFAQCTRKRRAFFQLGDDEIRIAEIITGVPKWYLLAKRRPEMIDGFEIHTGYAER